MSETTGRQGQADREAAKARMKAVMLDMAEAAGDALLAPLADLDPADLNMTPEALDAMRRDIRRAAGRWIFLMMRAELHANRNRNSDNDTETPKE